MIEQVDCVVIGAGVVGLAIARALALAGRETLVLEAQGTIGTGTSSRNSEVIHAGLYYPPGSAKARLCVRGRELLYPFCESHGVQFRRCGKLIVATDGGQLEGLRALHANARACGVYDLQSLTAAQALKLEPSLACVAALLSPSTGIIDSHGLMLALQSDLERAGGAVAFHARVLRGRWAANRVWLEVGGDVPTQLAAVAVVNCAGLEAPQLARSITDLPAQTIPTQFLAKGNYYTLAGKAPFRHLVYPLPEPGGLGVHLTLDLSGRARFGPDVEWIQQPDYFVDPARAERFSAAIRRYWPQLPDEALQPGYAGIRPKLSGPGQIAADFLIQGPKMHGVRGLVNLYGIESPGLTACLAIAEEVCGLLHG